MLFRMIFFDLFSLIVLLLLPLEFLLVILCFLSSSQWLYRLLLLFLGLYFCFYWLLLFKLLCIILNLLLFFILFNGLFYAFLFLFMGFSFYPLLARNTFACLLFLCLFPFFGNFFSFFTLFVID